MQHDPRASMLDMLIAIRRIHSFVAGKSREAFLNDPLLQSAVFGQSVIIGEAANRVPKDVQEGLPQVPWATIIGFRNRLIHGYDSVDWDKVFEIVWEMMPATAAALDKLVPSEEEFEKE